MERTLSNEDGGAGDERIVLRLLNSVEEGATSQRRIASDLGIALGLVNAYLKRCIKKGLVKVGEAPARRYAYYLTPHGFTEKSRLTVEYLSSSFSFFRQAKADCLEVFAAAKTRNLRNLVLCGKSDLAEVAILSAFESGISILAVIDKNSDATTFLGKDVFAASRAVRIALLVVLGAAAIYAVLLLQYAIRHGDVMKGINIDDIFGIGVPAIFVTFHQNIGLVIGAGLIAAVGFTASRLARILVVLALPVVLLLLFHIAARTALVALLGSLAFLGFAAVWGASKKAASLMLAVVLIAAAIGSGIFYQQALHKAVDPGAADAISRTVRELQDPKSRFRMQIWAQTLRAILNEPDRLMLGRGIGMYPVNTGVGAPDWLLRPTEGSQNYPHNVHIEVLYETGLVGLALFSVLTVFPLIASLRRWRTFPGAERSIMALYVFVLIHSDISGSFAYTYVLQFFLALAIGVIGQKRNDWTVVTPTIELARLGLRSNQTSPTADVHHLQPSADSSGAKRPSPEDPSTRPPEIFRPQTC